MYRPGCVRLRGPSSRRSSEFAVLAGCSSTHDGETVGADAAVPPIVADSGSGANAFSGASVGVNSERRGYAFFPATPDSGTIVTTE